MTQTTSNISGLFFSFFFRGLTFKTQFKLIIVAVNSSKIL